MLTYSTRRKTFFKQHLTFAAKPWKEARGKETIKRSFQVTNLLVWANKRMGLAFGMCGYPKEGRNKNSPQRKFTRSSSLVVEGDQCAALDRQSLGVAPPGQTGLCGQGCGHSFSGWGLKHDLPMASGLGAWTWKLYCLGFMWKLVNAPTSLHLSYLIRKIGTVPTSRCCSEDGVAC